MKTIIVYAHLLAACVAIGILLIQDLALSKGLGKPLPKDGVQQLKKTADIMFVALVVLWISGLALVLIGYIDNPQQYLLNEKLWGKFTVVSVLSLNGVALHFFSFPRITASTGLLGQPSMEQMMVAMTGAVSSVSWLFACYLGIARPWNYTVDYRFVMLVYAALVIAAIIVACNIVRTLKPAEPPILTQRVPINPHRK